MDFKLFVCVMIIFLLVRKSETACVWPSDFVNSTWIDSLKGDLVFESSTMTGWEFTVSVQAGSAAQTLNTWQCVTHDIVNNYLVMKTTQRFIQFVVNEYTAYRCLKLTKLTTASYRYYQIEPIQGSVSSERLTISDDDTLTDVSILCDETQGNHASGSEFQVMVKSGAEQTSIVRCPYYFLSDYTFTYTATDGTVSCNPTTDVGSMDLCSNKSVITVQNPTCAPYVLYSASNSVWCVDVVPVGTDLFINLFNGLQDVSTVDSSDTYRFSCMGVNSGGTQASVTPKHCKKDQTTSAIPIDNSAAQVGATLSLTTTSAPCPPCPFLTAPAQGSVSISTSGATTTATYTCELSYTLYGSATRVCQTNGMWSDSTPSCTCVTPESPTNGSVTLSNDGLSVTYTCDGGTVLIGVSTRTCTTDTNLWTGSSPTCGICQTLTAPNGGSYAITSTGMTSVVTYSCSSGTTLNGAYNRTCQTDTSWDLSSPSCTSCSTLTNPQSGTVTISTSGTVTTALFACTTGYTLLGSASATCCIDGTWDSNSPSCVCSDPTTPSNGSVIVSVDKTSATYTCDLWHTISGVEQRFCQTNGAGWSSSDPFCAECPAVSSPNNGSISVTSNGTVTMATYTCDVGFTLTGGSVSQCVADGTWSISSPSCTLCDTLLTPSSGKFTLITDGTVTTAQYTCDVGYTINGDVIISCQSTGAWLTSSSSNSTCVTCSILTSISDGTYATSTNGTTTVAEFSCTSGYSLVGEKTTTCQSDGTWDLEEPQCNAGATSTNGDTNNLLPAVIALAILAVLLAIALIVALWYIHRLKRSLQNKTTPSTSSNETYDLLQNNGIPAPKAPLDHQQHLLSIRNLSSSMAPMGFNASPRIGSISRPSVTSAASIGRLELDLMRESTSSSIIMSPDQPAPWTIKSNASSVKHTGQVSPKTGRKTRKKSKRLNRRVDIDNENPPFPTAVNKKEDMVPKEAKNRLTRDSLQRSISNPKHSNGRVSTPVNHNMGLSDPDSCSTPRSNVISTIQ